jgi:hypothetical protein
MERALAAFCILCFASLLLVLIYWDRQPRKEPQRPTVPLDQRLPPA